MRMLTALHDDQGSVRVPGLEPGTFPGEAAGEEEFRELAGVLDGVSLVGDGSLADRLWASYAITVTGLDVPTVTGAINAVQAVARARVTIRIPASGDSRQALNDVTAYLEKVAPWGVKVSFSDFVTGSGFQIEPGGPAMNAAGRALERAFGRAPRQVGQGGSIPLVAALARQFPQAEILLYGAEDDGASIHAPNERLVLDELKRIITTEALFLADYGGWHGAS